jgi:predicted Zn-dependent peptidase
MLDRTSAPKIKEIKDINYIIPQKYKLDNGTNLYTLPDLSSGIIKLDIIFKAGNEFQSKKLNAVFANALIKEAPVGMKPDEVAEFFDYYGSYIENFVNIDTSGIKLCVATNFFDDTIPVFANLITNPSLPENEFEIFKNKYSQNLKNNLQKTRYLAMTGINSEIFGTNNPRGNEILLEDVENVNLDDVREFTSTYYRANNCYVMVSGKVTNEVISKINTYFGNISDKRWNSKNNIIKPKPEMSEAKENFKLIKTNNPVQSTICIGKNLGCLNNKELIDVGILNTILGGYFGSRLMKNIREDKGYTYGINSFIVEYPDSVCLKIISDVGVNVTQQAISETFKEIKNLRENLITKTELKLVENFSLGELISAFDGVFPSSEMWQKLISCDKNEDFVALQIERMKTITPEEIRNYAVKFLSDEGFHTVVAGDIE